MNISRNTAQQTSTQRARRSLIHLREVVKAYPTAGQELIALRGVNADFHRGEFIVIFGKSGAGKSTLVNMITGVDDLTSGQVWVNGTSVHQLNESERALWRGQNVGVIYQTFELLPTLSLLDNVMLPMDFCNQYEPRESAARAMELLSDVGLADHVHKPPTRISGGQKQRVAIARALANDPPIIVADEPTGNLDSVTAAEIYQLFEGLVREGKTIVMVTHDQTLAQRASRVYRIRDGVMSDV